MTDADADSHTPTAAQITAVRRACMAKQRLDPSCRYPECSCHGMLAEVGIKIEEKTE